MQYIFIFIQWAVSGWCSWAAAALMDTWWFLWIWSADVWPMGFDSLECPVGSIPAWAQPIYFNHDPVGDWSALQLCHSSSAAVLYPERVLCRKGKGGPEMGHKPMCVWGIKPIFTIAHCLIQSHCRQEEFYEDGLTFLSRTHPYVGQKSIFSPAPNEPIYSCQDLDLNFYFT